MNSLELIIVPALWLIALGVMVYFRYRDQDELNPPVTERRRQERRDSDDGEPVQSAAEQRSSDDRRRREPWKEDYNVLKEKLEQDGPIEP